MGSIVSRCDVPPPLPSPPPDFKNGVPEKEPPKTLPSPMRFEDMQREILMSLRPEWFEGMRLEFAKPVNEQFVLLHSIYMGNIEIPTQGNSVYKCPFGTYEFGANVMINKMLLVGRMNSEGRMSGRVKYDFNDHIGFKWQGQFSKDPDSACQMVDLDLTGSDWNGQFKFGNNGFYGLNYMQSVTQNTALGCEVYYIDEQRKSGLGVAARRATDQYIATFQASTVGLISASYLHKIGEKTSLIADFLYNANSRDATTALGYDVIFSRAHVRGKIDSNGVLGAYLEERMTPEVQFIMSGEIDHWKKDYRFGFGLQLGAG